MLSNGEWINLIGIIVVFLTTIIGWVITVIIQFQILDKQKLSNLELTKIQICLEQQKEQNILYSTGKIERLNEIEKWVESCREVYLEASLLVGRKDIDLKEVVKSFRILFNKLVLIRKEGERIFYLSRIFDPIATTAPRWNWGSPDLPTDLPQLLNAIEDEATQRINEITERDMEFPFIEGQFTGLHEESIKAIERLRQSIRDTS
jgi:hypothetical protein